MLETVPRAKHATLVVRRAQRQRARFGPAVEPFKITDDAEDVEWKLRQRMILAQQKQPARQ